MKLLCASAVWLRFVKQVAVFATLEPNHGRKLRAWTSMLKNSERANPCHGLKLAVISCQAFEPLLG